jgi:MFS transporter, putative metabolite:H+ symporter
MHQWHITVNVVAQVTSAGFAGMFVGATMGGWLADRAGRKRGLIIGILTYTLFSFGNVFVWNVTSLAVLRFLTGIGLSAMTVIANTYISEVFPAAQRGKYLGMILTIGLIGIPAAAWVARIHRADGALGLAPDLPLGIGRNPGIGLRAQDSRVAALASPARS